VKRLSTLRPSKPFDEARPSGRGFVADACSKVKPILMSIVLELRDHCFHAGTPLVHQTSEDVVLSNVFGVVKNLNHGAVLTPWVSMVTGISEKDANWSVDFWQKQQRPVGIIEGSTIVDLVLESRTSLLFVEVKMDAPASSGTTHPPP
jgi:hypothetical protein